MTPPLICTCDPLSDEMCAVCRNRHHLQGQAVMPYRKNGPLLHIDGVSLSFKGKPVLKNVNIKIRRMIRENLPTGRIISFLGPSGIGKSQLLRILAGLQTPTSGNVWIDNDNDPNTNTDNHKVGVHAGLVGLVMQHYPLYRNRTVLGNLIIAASRVPVRNQAECLVRAKNMLIRFDLLDKSEMYPIQLSGGQRQRVAVAQQLLCSDHYLLLDEPTAGLDPISKKYVGALVQETANPPHKEGADINEEGVTIIMVTHDIPTAVALSDTIWIMGRDRDEQGNIIPGARIVDSYDLIECGLTWNPNVRNHPAYAPLVQELMDRFDTL